MTGGLRFALAGQAGTPGDTARPGHSGRPKPDKKSRFRGKKR